MEGEQRTDSKERDMSVRKDRVGYLGRAFLEYSQNCVISAEFKAKPCRVSLSLRERGGKNSLYRQCVNGGMEDSSLESNQTKDTLLIASSKTRGRKLVWFVSVTKARDN